MSLDMWRAVFQLVMGIISVVLIVLGAILLLFSVAANPRLRPQNMATSFAVLILGILIYLYAYHRRVRVYQKEKERKMIRAYHFSRTASPRVLIT